MDEEMNKDKLSLSKQDKYTKDPGPKKCLDFEISTMREQEENEILKEIRSGDFDKKGKKDGDLGEIDARSEIYLREGVTKKDYPKTQQNTQRDIGLNQMMTNPAVGGRPTSYPDLYVKGVHESEFRVHFYVTHLSTFFPKMELYKKLYDALQNLGETKEIAYQKTSEDFYDFAIGMKEDKTALEIIERNKLSSFLSSFERGEMKPSTEIGSGFKVYADAVLKGNSKKRQEESNSHRYHEKDHEKYSHRDGRGSSPSPRSREDKYDKRHQRRDHSPHHHSRFSDRGPSRSRSRSNSPTRYSDRKREHEKSHQDRDRSRKGASHRENSEPDYHSFHRQEETPSYIHHPPPIQVQAVDYQSAMTHKNALPSYLTPQKRFDNSVIIPVPGQTNAPFVMNQQVDLVLGSENYCCFLGLPCEITEKQVIDSLKAQNYEVPIEVEPVQEGVMHYLKLCFKSQQTVRDLIYQDVYVGPTTENLIFPVLVLPLIRDKKVDELLVHHQVQVESSIPVDALFLGLFYDPYGMMVDCIDMKPTRHVLIFSKRRYAERVLAIPNISLQKDDVEIVMQHSLVDNCYPLLRKNLQSQLQSLLSRYIKDVYSEDNSLSPTKEQPGAESKELIEEAKEPKEAAAITITQPRVGESIDLKKFEKNKDPQQQQQQHYEEMYYAAKQPSGYIHERNYNEQDQGQYHYHEEPGGRREFPRNEAPNYYNNPRYIPDERGGQRGGRGGTRGNRGGGGFHYQRGGRGQDPRHGQYPQQPYYHQNRQKGPRNVERGTDYRN